MERSAMALPPKHALILCGGLQSSGTTLVSYCFLQRGDTNGVLDADNDLLPAIDPRLAQPFAWYKTTISCFRLSEIAEHYRDAGWNVRTLLVLRDLRAVWASLRGKSYGRNGITAEDPPLAAARAAIHRRLAKRTFDRRCDDAVRRFCRHTDQHAATSVRRARPAVGRVDAHLAEAAGTHCRSSERQRLVLEQPRREFDVLAEAVP